MDLEGWPTRLDGYKIALLADHHIRDEETILLTQRALNWVLAQSPDIIVFAGDLIAYWKPGVESMIRRALAPLQGYDGTVLAVPGNHDYFGGEASDLAPVLDEFGVRLLSNECAVQDSVCWICVDSVNADRADTLKAVKQSDPSLPMILLWHEPDAVRYAPSGPVLMLSGHSHGGQFVTPWGWAPATSENGREFIRGYYPDAPIPLYVSRGLGTTGPPARLFCPPEVTLLTLYGRV